VLNYPDPRKRLLQQCGTDTFLLATENHLGNLQQIELWFDSIGPNPTWYCKDIIIYDLQQRTEWYFKVKQHLSVTKGVTHIVVELFKEKPIVIMNRSFNFKFNNRYHTWYLWQHEANFAYVKKLTVILSTVMTTYALTLFFLGLPSLHMKDVLDQQYSVSAYTVFIAFISSFPSFMLHIAVAWCFRFSKLQFSKIPQEAKLPFSSTIACW
jgi:hypothetical protein